ncbi:MAG: hypothetical protein LBR11_01610 [Deltaproteobacteria bacterium]|nr:hypothetical protein [Deltaproteobacteria bacterium]
MPVVYSSGLKDHVYIIPNVFSEALALAWSTLAWPNIVGQPYHGQL